MSENLVATDNSSAIGRIQTGNAAAQIICVLNSCHPHGATQQPVAYK
jgi:hypothetical protein